MLSIAESIVRTDTGRHRSGNEDAAFAAAPVFVLADGMGGAQAGEVASRIAIESFERGLPDGGSPEQRLAAAVQRANGEIHRRSVSEAENMGMGTTVTSVMLDGDSLAIAHVGDSRAYLLRDGELRQLTEDHSLVGELMREGRLTEQQALDHPQRSMITRAVGIEPDVDVDTWTYPLRPGDVVLLCSDGLTDMMLEERVRRALVESRDLAAAADRLIDEANAAGGRDNITVVLFRVQAGEGAPTVDAPTEIRPASELEPGSGHASPDPEQTTSSKRREPASAHGPIPVAPPPRGGQTAPLARLQGWSQPRIPKGFVQSGRQERQFGRLGKTVAATVAVATVLLVIGGAGYLAIQQIYFLGTNEQGIVTVYQGLPYKLPFGVRLYSTFYTSGVPAQTIPAARRSTLLNHAIRDQKAAINLVNDVELGKIDG